MMFGTDRPTILERAGQADCLVEMGLAWLQRPLGGQSHDERAAAIADICLVISQMRHREPRLMDSECARWIQRVTVRLCQQCGGLRGFDGGVQVELARRVSAAGLTYHHWRDSTAPVVRPIEHAGPSEGQG